MLWVAFVYSFQVPRQIALPGRMVFPGLALMSTALLMPTWTNILAQ